MTAKQTLHTARVVGGTAALLFCVLLTGCGVVATGDSPVSPVSVPGSAFKGNAHGGQQPVSGSTIGIYAAGLTGYGSAYAYASGTSLLGSTVVTTDANGNFSIPAGTYTCPTASTEIYLNATGGNPGISYPTGAKPPNNTALALMAALGPCGSLSSQTFITINEITTVASVWALSPFMTGATHIGTNSSNPQGLTNAFSAVNSVANISIGQPGGPNLPAGAILPVAKINTLADILSTCINSAGGVAGDNSACGNLFTNTTVNGVAPTDTITAAMNMAQHPTSHVAALTNSASATPPFQPTLSTVPNDLNIVISYSAGGFSTPRAVAVDTSGNVWVPNAGTSTVTEMNSTGTLLSGTLGYAVGSLNVPVAVAVDQNGNAWVANSGNATVSRILAGGSSGTAYTVGTSPSGVAVDAFGSVFVANNGGSSMSKINSAGTVTTTAITGVSSPVGIALNPK